MKRVRAATRLLADADGLDLRFIEHSCRDVARQWSALRDLDVMIATIDAQEGAPQAWPPGFRDALTARRAAEIDRGVLGEAARRDMAERLRAADRALADLDLEHLSESQLRHALRRTHRKAVKALSRCRKRATDERFHELRKRAKRELYQRELLEAAMSLHHPRRTERLDAVCDSLGEQQDIAVLRSTLDATAVSSPLLDAWLRERRDGVRERAIGQADALYG
jgi:CHAD domain-containing protein